MDSNSEDGDYQNLANAFQQDASQYKVTYTHGRNTKEVRWVTPSNTHISICWTVLFIVLLITMQNVYLNSGGGLQQKEVGLPVSAVTSHPVHDVFWLST